MSTSSNLYSIQFSSVQSLSHVRLFVTPWITARQASLSITISRSSLKLMSIESVMPSSHLILCRSLLLLPQIPPSIRVFSHESTLRMRWPKYWSFSFSITPSKEIPGLISIQNGPVESPCSPRDSQESFPTPQLKVVLVKCFLSLIEVLRVFILFLSSISIFMTLLWTLLSGNIPTSISLKSRSKMLFCFSFGTYISVSSYW